MPKTTKVHVPAYGEGIQGDASIDISEECFTCKHLTDRLYPFFCRAYPEGIPQEIGSGKISHKKPFKGDNNIQYEKENKMKPIVDEEESTISALLDSMSNIGFWCSDCKHKHPDTYFTCDAFPEQIPDPILGGPVVHDKPMYEQKNDIIFEKKEE